MCVVLFWQVFLLSDAILILYYLSGIWGQQNCLIYTFRIWTSHLLFRFLENKYY